MGTLHRAIRTSHRRNVPNKRQTNNHRPAVMPVITTELQENIMETAELYVAGMTCGSCVASVTRALKRVPGVKDVHVDLSRGTAQITGEEAAQQLPALLAALSDAGYEASAKTTAASEDHVAPVSHHSAKATGAGKGSCCCRR